MAISPQNAKLGWIAYRFKLWAGVRYGFAVLVTPLSILAGVLKKQNFWLLLFLGVNHNVKREWQTTQSVWRHWPI